MVSVNNCRAEGDLPLSLSYQKMKEWVKVNMAEGKGIAPISGAMPEKVTFIAGTASSFLLTYMIETVTFIAHTASSLWDPFCPVNKQLSGPFHLCILHRSLDI